MDSKTLIVDLDNSLIKSDTLFEIILAKLKQNIISFINIFLYLFKGKAQLKQFLSSTTNFDIKNIPTNQKVIDLIKDYKKDGYQIILVTGSNQIIADKVHNNFDFFDKCYGSTNDCNLVGKEKYKFIKDVLKIDEFAYVGDSKKDLFIWDHAKEVIFVENNNKHLKKQIKDKYSRSTIIENQKKSFNFFRLIRLHQWTKNLLIFLPSILAGTILVTENIMNLFLGFIAFSLLASATYILNDLIDLDSDRMHKSKKFRSIASGEISIPLSLLYFVGLLLIASTLSLMLPKSFSLYLFFYLILTLSYSFFLKKKILIDCIVLSILYLVRILIGSAITGDGITFWFMSFSFFFFLSLAFLKRYIELLNLEETNSAIGGRAYLKNDQNLILSFGQSSGLISILVFSLYLYEKNAIEFQNDYLISWLIIPLLIYWITRIWFLAGRGLVNHDPVVFAISDRVSFIVLFSCFLVFTYSGLL